MQKKWKFLKKILQNFEMFEFFSFPFFLFWKTFPTICKIKFLRDEKIFFVQVFLCITVHTSSIAKTRLEHPIVPLGDGGQKKLFCSSCWFQTLRLVHPLYRVRTCHLRGKTLLCLESSRDYPGPPECYKWFSRLKHLRYITIPCQEKNPQQKILFVENTFSKNKQQIHKKSQIVFEIFNITREKTFFRGKNQNISGKKRETISCCWEIPGIFLEILKISNKKRFFWKCV